MSLFNTTSNTLVNTSVVSVKNKTLLHWSILEVPEEVETVQQFFSDTVEGVAHTDGFDFQQFVIPCSYIFSLSFVIQNIF